MVCTLSYCINSLWSRNYGSGGEIGQYIREFAILIIPMIFSMTTSQYSNIIVTTQLLILSALIFTGRKQSVKMDAKKVVKRGHSGYVVAFRSYLQMLTVVAILAVDFNVFPRKFAKCETFGTSLMDVGVGCFVFSSGFVAGPRLQTGGSLKRTIKLVLPVLLLGVIRAVLTKAVDYQEHVSEYGVHWNFFITLGLMPLLIYIQNFFFRHIPLYSIALITLGVYQYSLATGVEEFIMHSPRIDFLSMNREGIFSLAGFYSLFLLAAQVGKECLPIAKTSHEKLSALVKYFALYSASLYLLLEVYGIPVSRRMVNQF